MKKLLIGLVIVVIVLMVLSFAKDAIIKMGVEKGVELVTGCKLAIEKMNVGIIKTLVSIRNMNLNNPAGFKEKTMMDMPEIYVDYDLPSVFSGKIHIKDMRIDLKEFCVIKNEKGELNIDSLKVVKSQKQKPAQKEKPMAMQIDSLQLKIGKVLYKDYSKGGAPSVSEFDLNLNEKYSNITDPNALVALIVVKALFNTTIGKLANIDLGGLKNSIGDTLGTAQKATTQAIDTTKETIKQTTETIKKIKLPFGGEAK